MANLDLSLGQLAREVPGATALFHKHKLDFCCGGGTSLRDAARRRQVDPAQIAAELEALMGADPAPEEIGTKPDVDLIEYILERYHDRHRHQLPELIRLARRVELVHGGHPQCPAGLSAVLEDMQQELEAHMAKEEQILFPMIARGMGATARMPIAVMRQQHDHHGELLREVDRRTRDLTLPEGACNTWTALYRGLAELRKDLMDHIHLENNVLFHRCDLQR